MKIMIVGSGGREHALAWKLAQSDRVSQMWCAPGNGGTQGERLHSGALVENVPIKMDDIDGLCAFANENRPDLVVVGPDETLALGLVDRLEDMDIKAFGPTQECAKFESSKAYTQSFCAAAGIPIVDGESFRDVESAIHFAQELGGCCVVKASGLARGKGVVICDDTEEATRTIRNIMEQRLFGDAGREVVIQRFVEDAYEASFHYLCDGKSLIPFPPTKDYKRRLDGETGPNTGGMGATFPHRGINDKLKEQFRREVVHRWLGECEAQGLVYRGVLYPGAIVGSDGIPRLLEFNCRFGDPETQVYMRMLNTDLLPFFVASTEGGFYSQNPRLQGPHWHPGHCVCVVLVAEGYPEETSEGKLITGIDEANQLTGVKIFHSGTLLKGGRFYTNGGRILSVTASGHTINNARDKVYDAVSRISFEGMSFRRDIAE